VLGVMCNAHVLLLEFTERYRPIDVERLLAFAGVRNCRQVAPAMHQFAIEFTSDEAAQRADERLRAVRLDGRPVLSVARNGRRIAASCAITAVLDPATQVECDSEHHWSRENFFSIFRATLLSEMGIAP
jgi:hypothetical protein